MIGHHTSAVDLPLVVVTQPARHVLMRAGERKRGACIVVELGRGPAAGVVTRPALHHAFASLELPGVNVLMTARATLGGRLERDLAQAGARSCLGIRRPMAIQAAEYAMPPGEREGCGFVIEILQLAPRAHAVTRFANALTGFQMRLGDCGKLALMRILVAALAGDVRKMKLPVRARRSGFFAVTILARYSGVRALQSELRFLMHGQRERGWMEAFHLVTVFAAVIVRRARELAGVWVLVAVQTSLGGRVIVGVEPGGKMALGAGQALVLSEQRILGRLVAGFLEGGRLPAVLRMAGRAFAVVRAAHELALVLVLVTVHALLMRHRRLEIRFFMALLAGEPVVLAVQRKPGFGVVKAAL